jgi:hypothetical protein
VQKSNEDVLEHRLLELPIKAFEFKYSPVTLSFILVILKIVGLIQFRIDHKNGIVKCRARGDNLHMNFLTKFISSINGVFGIDEQ